jgi:hypothetical protein
LDSSCRFWRGFGPGVARIVPEERRKLRAQ